MKMGEDLEFIFCDGAVLSRNEVSVAALADFEYGAKRQLCPTM